MKPTARFEGLEEVEAQARLARVGPNVLKAPATRGIAQILRGTLHEPMFLFLLAAAVLYLLVGDLGEGLFLVGGALVSVGLVVVQEMRSERALISRHCTWNCPLARREPWRSPR